MAWRRTLKRIIASRWSRRLFCYGLVSVATAGVMVVGIAQPAPPRPAHAELPAHLGYGINVRLESSIESTFAPLELEWIKLWQEYEGEPPAERLPYNVLFTIDCRDGSPSDLEAWGDGIEALAISGLGLVEAYEVCNEPNVKRFWGGQPPDPAQYVQMLQEAYRRIKAVDPSAIVVSGGLAPVGRIQGECNGWTGNDCGAMDEREYARQMFLLGAGEAFDAFGYHPYGFAYAPETDPHTVSQGFAFRGAEVMYDLMDQNGLGDRSIWATEFNWLREWQGPMPDHCDWTYETVFGWMEVSEIQQANYITRAFQYADENWPWMGPMFVWNLDWHTYHTWDCEAGRFFSLLHEDGCPTLAYQAVQAMEKRPGSMVPVLSVEPLTLSFMVDVDEPTVLTATIHPQNTGRRVVTWTADVAPHLGVTPTLVVTSGVHGAPLTVTIDTAGYMTGTHTGLITVTATTSDVLGSPQTVGVRLYVVPEIHAVYLPLALRE